MEDHLKHMKARYFLLIIVMLVTISILVTLGLWQISNSQSPLKIESEKTHLPEAARFISNEAPLTIHISLDTNKFPKYIEALAAESHRKEARKGAEEFRNGLFALAGLNYEKDLFDWMSPKISLSILDSDKVNDNKKWLLAIESKKDHTPAKYIETFWETKSKEGINIKKILYKDSEIVTGYINYSGKQLPNLSTCLVDKDILLLSTSEDLIKKSIDLSNENISNQMSDINTKSIIEKLDNGIGIISISPKALHEWFGLSKEVTTRDDFKGLIASFNAENSNILLDGLFKVDGKSDNNQNRSHDGEYLLNNSNIFAEDYGLISNPASILDENNKEFSNQLIRPVLKKALAFSRTPADYLIASIEEGEMAWFHDKKEWLLGTRKGSQLPFLEEKLKQKKFIKTILPQEGYPLKVWSRLKREEQNNADYIKTDLAIILSQEENKNLWSNSLNLIEKRDKNNSFIPIYQLSEGLLRKNDDRLSHEVYLGSESAKETLKDWSPWLLINSISSKSLQPSIKRLALAFGPEEYNDSEVYLRAMLEFS